MNSAEHRDRRFFLRTPATVMASVIVLLGALISQPAQAQTYEVLYTFGGPDGANPTRVILDKTGNLYGITAAGGGSANAGVVYKLSTMGTQTVLHSFTGGPDGGTPRGALALAGKYLYGATTNGGTGYGYGVVYKVSTTTGTETVLYTFTGAGPDGAFPFGGVVRDSLGNLYGTTIMGGSNGYGVIFKVSPSGTETVLHSFTAAEGANCSSPLRRDNAGNLYGTCYGGGAYSWGTVFKLNTTGTVTVLHNFTGGSDGGNPYAGVIQDKAGNLYGTTPSDGYNWGVVYELSPTGTETVKYSFTGGLDGGDPEGGLMLAVGTLYGTTAYWGANGVGTVFKVDSAGAETVLYNFAGGTDGSHPVASLVQDASGNLYGTALYRGSPTGCDGFGCGVVFRISP